MLPLISCIMPTMPSRLDMIQDAVTCYDAQTHQNRELIIVADPPQQFAAEIGRRFPDVKIISTAQKVTIGQKRNIACEWALGEFVACWDDDDYYEPRRLERQLAALVETGKTVSTFQRALFQDAGKWYMSPPSDLGIGSSLFFRRSWWQDHKFTHTSLGEDRAFAHAAAVAGQLVALPDQYMMYVRRHADNTWKQALPAPGWDCWSV